MFKRTLLDCLFIAILLALSTGLLWSYIGANALNTGYEDWMVHAFRVKSLQEFGFTSWTHIWSNGISLWKAYQFVPHYVTLFVSTVFSLEVTRAMVVVIMGQFIALRLIMYAVLRLLKFHPITAFVCAVLSFDIAHYWGAVGDYSLLFGVTLFPFILYLWAKFTEGKLQYIFPYIAGLTFYVHPLLGFTTLALWATTTIFSEKSVLSFSVLTQFVIALISSSLFWLPLVTRDSYMYSSPTFANKEFLQLLLSSYKYYGLSLFVLGAFVISVITSLMPLHNSYKWARILTLFVSAFLLLIIVGTAVDLPRFIAQFQFTRGATFVGIGILFAFAPVIERLMRMRMELVRGLVLFIGFLSLVESVWLTSIYAPYPRKEIKEPISSLLERQDIDLKGARIWSPTIGDTSYSVSSDLKMPYSYMAQLDPNQIPQRLTQLILYQPYLDRVPELNLKRLDNYFRITGTKYILLEEQSSLARSFSENKQFNYSVIAQVAGEARSYVVFETPWQVRNAVLVDKKYEKTLAHFPFELEVNNVNDQIALDGYVNNLSTVLYREENKKLPVVYPNQEKIDIAIPANRTTDLVFINESYDSNWSAYLNGRRQDVRSSGPNFMVVQLDDTTSAGTLTLKHTWPISFYASIFLIGLIPLELLLVRGVFTIVNRSFSQRKEGQASYAIA